MIQVYKNAIWDKFGARKIEHLGFMLTSDGIRPCQAKVEPICLAPAPKDIVVLKKLQSFLGLLNYFHKF
uniref:Reverse transcriptase domain-containing protein n=1 Tax=Anopheles stephensi TaxID=30069 RepID=A0A182YST6_ANOST